MTLKNRLMQHLRNEETLTDNEILQLMTSCPEALVDDIAYRVLLFSGTSPASLDKSVSLSREEVLDFILAQDASKHSAITVYQSNVRGIDLNKIADVFNFELPSFRRNFKEIITLEICPGDIVYSGSIAGYL